MKYWTLVKNELSLFIFIKFAYFASSNEIGNYTFLPQNAPHPICIQPYILVSTNECNSQLPGSNDGQKDNPVMMHNGLYYQMVGNNWQKPHDLLPGFMNSCSVNPACFDGYAYDPTQQLWIRYKYPMQAPNGVYQQPGIPVLQLNDCNIQQNAWSSSNQERDQCLDGNTKFNIYTTLTSDMRRKINALHISITTSLSLRNAGNPITLYFSYDGLWNIDVFEVLENVGKYGLKSYIMFLDDTIKAEYVLEYIGNLKKSPDCNTKKKDLIDAYCILLAIILLDHRRVFSHELEENFLEVTTNQFISSKVMLGLREETIYVLMNSVERGNYGITVSANHFFRLAIMRFLYLAAKMHFNLDYNRDLNNFLTVHGI